MNLPKALQRTINSLNKLPGIGPKSAERLGFFMLKMNDSELEQFASAVANLKKDLKFCEKCFNVDEKSPCSICEDIHRDIHTICIVETPLDLIAIEKTGLYKGVYHILGGVLSPIDGIGPDDIKIKELISRVLETKLDEIIFALNPSMESEATTMYIKNQLANENIDIKITRIAQGLPTGSNIEYADDSTLRNAFDGRTLMNSK